MIFAVKAAFGQKTYTSLHTLPEKEVVSFQQFAGRPGAGRLKIIAPDHYSSQLGFFCKQEIRFESVIKFPFRFRLGSIDHTDWLEGKRNAWILHGSR